MPKYSKKIKIYQKYTKNWATLVVITPMRLIVIGEIFGGCKIMAVKENVIY